MNTPSAAEASETAGRLDPDLLHALHARASGTRWGVTPERLERSLTRAVDKAFIDRAPDRSNVRAFLEGLHLEDLALAAACEDGHDAAWEHFVREFRPQLYRAAESMDSTGSGRELADSLYGDLFGLPGRDGERRSLFRYFHGRSRLSTWLRSVLAQRHVDAVRHRRRLEPLDDVEDDPRGSTAPDAAHVSECGERVADALRAAVAALSARDRLRVACYYAQHLTLAQIGRMTGEHEATVSRQLAKTRGVVRREVEAALTSQHQMSHAAMEECVKALAADPGNLDVADLLGMDEARKNPPPDRSR